MQEWRARWDRMDRPYEDLKCQIEMVSGSSPQGGQGGLDNSRKLEKLTYRPLKAHFSNQRPVLVPSSVNAPNITKPIFCFLPSVVKRAARKFFYICPLWGGHLDLSIYFGILCAYMAFPATKQNTVPSPHAKPSDCYEDNVMNWDGRSG